MDKPKQTAKKQIITIVGGPGSGKSSAAKAVAQQLGYEHFSSGDLFRELARQNGVDDLTRALRTPLLNDKLDKLVDSKLKEIGITKNHMAIDSRMAALLIPSSFKVFLKLDLNLAAQRILNDLTEHRKTSENIPASPQLYADSLAERMKVDAGRYKLLYGMNPYDTQNYDLVVDTGANDLQQTVKLIIDRYKKWLAQK